MALGVYMNDLSDYEDTGTEQKSSITNDTFSPDFRSRSTFQLWKAYRSSEIVRWIGATLVKDEVHNIVITNVANQEIVLDFDDNYTLLDQIGSKLTIGIGGSAHFYAVGFDDALSTFTLGMRVGSQDNRKVTT